MKIRVLGCSGGIGGKANLTTSLLVDEDILIDCGTGVGELSLHALMAIDHVFLTHSHLDHLAMLPMLIDTVADLRSRPITLYASEETLRILRAHVFNWLIWPDFTAIPDRLHPLLRMQPVKVGETVHLGERAISPIPALHSVPSQGYALRGQRGALAFSGDTTVCDEQVAALNAIEDLHYLLIEAAFPNAHQDLAHAARHLSPSMLHRVLDRLNGSPEIFVTHFKPGHADLLAREVLAYDGRLRPHLHLLGNGQTFDL
ncbi:MULTISPECIES: 3',5'-cyclic-nucleotide phosphodiesterase [unclassified Uliginosibacterium]|uniref:3',5'-cyclic-nucleotide phosphodiesterase n=1 Tax=unclassified Uliginosibacterium TaxID=2621521 RepID=UPI000C7DCD63|nr:MULTISPECIES: 3',5'-cyclic-nucleotide phosphodiesterase [unclassified Uliginosibacterium]MDO6386927.1 3',5'-cyclic-nucleotide phosphodiesterase [Uliginosibacterium sp. 31-12]PLK49611.1 3',5'-cyclic-nucleotide phosphodiesterase [Uliginosibacterium sp. TH139]